jgi:RNA polymerase sigma factor (sigma-70 family)
VQPYDRNTWLAKEVLVHERALRGYLGRFFSEPSDVQDAVQETYARILSLPDATRSTVHNWHAFLFTTARNIALDRLRRRRIVSLDALAEIDSVHVMDERPTAYEELSARQELTMLADTIATLPDRCRQVFTLRKLYGMSQKEIASHLGISESTVEKHVATGVRLCAERMYASREGGAKAAQKPVRTAPGSTGKSDAD